ncbi:MAG: hypothetical protein ACKV2Q_33180 [Planctomycetaceae bacterium]
MPPRTLEHTGLLEDLTELPQFLRANIEGEPRYACSFCGVGDTVRLTVDDHRVEQAPLHGRGLLTVESRAGRREFAAEIREERWLDLELNGQPPLTGPMLSGHWKSETGSRDIVARSVTESSRPGWQRWALALASGSTQRTRMSQALPTAGCLKLRTSMGLQRPVFPIHAEPSLRRASGEREALTYAAAIRRLADLLIKHRPPDGRTLIYACGQIDYFTIFAFQEVFRLLGIRNLAGNAEHCLNAGAVHNELLTGQEGPFLTVDQGLNGPNRFYLLNGWNGLISHPPVFAHLFKRPDLTGYLVEVIESESARAFVKRCGEERLLLVRSGSDPHLALSVAHEVLTRYPQAVESRFLERFADRESFENYRRLALSETFEPARTAERIAPEPAYAERLLNGIRDIAAQLVRPEVVPINIPSVGLSQTKGVVAHCLWGSLLAMLGKYGLKADGTPAGGTVRIPGQINAQTEVQGLSRNYFMGRVRFTPENVGEVARRMGLPEDAYQVALTDTPRAALDYSDPSDVPELFICFGTQFESNMLGRRRWIEKLKGANTTLVVVDPIPDPFTVEHADLIIPSPPHAAAAKVYQNGEWRLSLSSPQKQRAAETRTDATIVYDVMAEISQRLRADADLRHRWPELGRLSDSGYLQQRFEPVESGGELARLEGEVSRPKLWGRIQDYMTGPNHQPEGASPRLGTDHEPGASARRLMTASNATNGLGPLYCRPEHADGRLITWDDLVQQGEIIYGGVGTTRYRLDYDDPTHVPFRDIWRRPGRFKFFVPTEADLALTDGLILDSGRSTLSDDKKRIHFAVATFNSGKATTSVDLPDENPLYVSLSLAAKLGLSAGDFVRVTGIDTQASLVLPVIPTSRVLGRTLYISFHKCKAEIEQGRYLNDLTSHLGRCPYTAQSNFKLTRVTLERVT